MHSYVALLRAVNVGGTAKLPMSDLAALGRAAGFGRVRTLLASGNLLFTSPRSAAEVGTELERRLEKYAGRPVGVVVRTAAEIAAVLAANPFPDRAPNRTVAIFLPHAPPKDALAHARGLAGEEMVLGVREIYVHYGGGMADSRLRIPAAAQGTARNMNTVAKLASLAAGSG